MKSILTLLTALLSISVLNGADAAASDESAERLFVRRIQPLLSAKCLACHGQDEKKIEGGLDLRSRAAALTGGESGKAAFVIGNPDKSPLLLAVMRHDDDWSAMPPKEAEKLTAELGEPKWIQMSERIAKIMREEKKLEANVDFYSATVYYSMGLPTDLFTPIFAVARMAGWTGHVLEQWADNRLFRPDSEYVGPALGRKVVPINQR